MCIDPPLPFEDAGLAASVISSAMITLVPIS